MLIRTWKTSLDGGVLNGINDVTESNLWRFEIGTLIASAALGSLGVPIFARLGVLVVVGVACWRLWSSLGSRVGICELACVLAAIQWLLAPLLAYDFFPATFSRYRMYVDDTAYFKYAIPGTALFIIGMMLSTYGAQSLPRKAHWKQGDLIQYAWTFLVCSVAVDVVEVLLQTEFGFAGKIVKDLRFASMLMFYLSNAPYRWWVVSAIGSVVILAARSSGMFHGVLLWSSMFMFYYFIRTPRSQKHKLALLVVGVIAAIVIQFAKSQYRSHVWAGEDVSFLAVAQDVTLEQHAFTDNGQLSSAVSRFNQGWIVSRIMSFIPAERAHLEGRSIYRAFEATLLPRFLVPDKATAGGRENFMMFTGLRLGKSTSMGISLLGEGYGNFGAVGGCFFLLIAGVGFGAAVRLVSEFMRINPVAFFLLPIIFLDAVKAETDLVTILNYVAKAGFVTAVMGAILSAIATGARRVKTMQVDYSEYARN